MALYSNDDIQSLSKGFDKLGFNLKNIDQNDMSRWSNDELNKDSRFYTENLSLVNKYFSPIVVQNYDTGNVYNVYWRSGYWNISNFYGGNNPREYFSVDNEGNLEVNQNFKDSLYVELSEKGKKQIAGENIDITEYKSTSEFANFENFDSVEAPNYSNIFIDDPQLSVVNPTFDINALTDAQIKKAEQKLKDSIGKWEQLKSTSADELQTAMWSFDEIDEIYNLGISEDDKRAYFLYLQNKTRKKLKGDWDKKYGCSYPAEASYILGLMKRGALFYDPSAKFGERLQPKVIYQSGNIWKKYGSLTNRKEEIIQRFGEEIYKTHFEVLDAIFTELKDNRLSVRSEDKSMRLFMSPNSQMAEDITIKQFFNPRDKTAIESNFLTYTQIKDGKVVIDTSIKMGDYDYPEKTISQMLQRLKTKFGKNPNDYKDKTAEQLKSILQYELYDYKWFEGKNYADSKFTQKSTLTLREGFIRWCREAGEGLEAQKHGIQFGTQIRNIKQLTDYYLNPLQKNPFSGEANGKDTFNRYKNEAKKVGERLFAQFLSEALQANDQIRVEYIWNSQFNSYVDPDLSKVPIGFTFKKYLDGDTLFQLSEFNLRAIKYYLTRGSAGLAYGVGVGKTFCSIFVIKQALDLGLATRPLIIVPNQVYQQFKFEVFRALGSEFNDSIPNSRINGFFNGMDEKNTFKGNNAVDGVNICTYKATELFTFDAKTIDKQWVQESCLIIDSAPTLEEDKFIEQIVDNYSEVLYQASVDEDKSTQLVQEIPQNTMGDVDSDSSVSMDEDLDLGDGYAGGGAVKKELPKIFINSPSTNYDMIVVDEAHNFNNLFEGVEMPIKEEQGGDRVARIKNPFSSIRETSASGEGSARAKKLWFLARYVQKINRMGNTILLSATPFTNSPIQVYSLMSILNWEYLDDNDMGVIGSFFLNYAKTDYTEDFKTDLTITRRNKLIGWNNVVSLQKYIFRYFDKSTREDEDKLVVRPNKWALPLKRLMVDGAVVEFAKENYISTTIRMSDLQTEIWRRIRDYAKPKDALDYEDLCSEEWQNTTRWGRYTPPARNNNEDEVDVENADNLSDGSEEGEKAKNSAKAITCLQWGRQVANNPYVYKCSGFKKDPTPSEYVEESPKMLYVMECIRSVKEWHEKQTDPQLKKISGQVIYMDFQPKAFIMFRDYLVENLGFSLDEIGIISGSGNMIGKKSYSEKQIVADAFIGRILNKNDEYVTLPEEKRLKVLIGSSAIKEGINLQNFSSVLYNCYIDFNPTDRIQVEGRIWRQGNIFKNVRIVTPLMADSIDIFIFQKLEDKTERINQLWTRNGNANELDTTAFDPSELKYELLSDPEQIAILEAENKKEKLNQEKVEKNEVLSQYITLEKVYEKANIIKARPVTNWQIDIRLHLYYNLSIIRPDLIELPLLNQEGYLKFAKAFISQESVKDNYYASTFTIEEYPNIYAFMLKFNGVATGEFNIADGSVDKMTPLKEMYINGLFNYTMEELINLMVQVLKEQKIAFPLGYSKNWRELLPETPLPIIEGDEVEFDTKKGRKKGKAELVKNYSGNLIVNEFWEDDLQQYLYGTNWSDYLQESLQKAGVKKSNLTQDKLLLEYEQLSDSDKKEVIALLKWMYKNDTKDFVRDDTDFAIKSTYVPYRLDVDEFEDLMIEEKNIVKVEKEVVKKVEPTKYPEPFTWSNKDRDELLLDIMEYNVRVQFPNKPKIDNNDLRSLNVIFGDKDRSKFMPYFTDRFSTLSDVLLSQSSSSQSFTILNQIINLKKAIENKTRFFPSTWAELMANWQDKNGGLYKSSFTDIYNSSYALVLAEFRQSYEKKMLPLGITNISDVKNLVTEQRTTINAIDIEITNLNKKEVLDELIQQVRDTQAKLASDEIRAGSSFRARANLFANSNTDYLGNDMLGLQQAPKPPKEDKKKQVIEEVVIVEETSFDKEAVREFIEQLKPALFSLTGKAKKELKEYIEQLEPLLNL